jgi:hypothetical protein
MLTATRERLQHRLSQVQETLALTSAPGAAQLR